jgi:muramidase (phage lysozyme)
MKKILLLLLLNGCFSYCFSQNNPYSVFGYKPKVIFKDVTDDVYKVKNADPNSKIKSLEFDYQNHLIKLLDQKDSVIQSIAVADDKLLRFLSVDPITKKYPELTPYQFASNSSISGIDRDGLEYYYVGDGTLIGKMGADTRVMLISHDVTTAQAYVMMTAAHSGQNGVDQLNANSKYVGLNNAELNVRAMLTTIRRTEGHGELTAYNVRYGGETFDPAEGHPGTFKFREKIKGTGINGKKAEYHMVPHSPAGAFQITEPTFNSYKIAWNLTDFSAPVQERVAIAKMKDRNALTAVENGNWASALSKLRNEWSSLPGGVQPGMKLNNVLIDLKTNVSNELNNKSVLVTPQGKLIP